MTNIRPCRPADLPDLYRIALATGDAGAHAAGKYRDPELVGHVYAAPYAVLEPRSAFVAEDEAGVAGYILGATDTRAFEALAEAKWWPALRARYASPPPEPFTSLTPDERLRWLIHHPWRAPDRIVEPFPAHLHINLLPRVQGQGLGRRLIDLWLETARGAGARGVHLGVNTANQRAIRFYRAYGLVEPTLAKAPPKGTVWFAAQLGPRE